MGKEDSIKLSSSVEIIIVQFSFKNREKVPSGLRQVSKETQTEREQRTCRPNKGIRIINPTEKTEISILDGLEKAGYELVDAFFKPRIDPKDIEPYQMVRFTFRSKGTAKPSWEFKRKKDENRKEMESMCYFSLWRVRGFLNPYFQNEEVVAGKNMVSINLEALTPRYNKDGTPFIEWLRDAGGKKVGENANPITPNKKLIVEDNVLKLLSM